MAAVSIAAQAFSGINTLPVSTQIEIITKRAGSVEDKAQRLIPLIERETQSINEQETEDFTVLSLVDTWYNIQNPEQQLIIEPILFTSVSALCNKHGEVNGGFEPVSDLVENLEKRITALLNFRVDAAAAAIVPSEKAPATLPTVTNRHNFTNKDIQVLAGLCFLWSMTPKEVIPIARSIACH